MRRVIVVVGLLVCLSSAPVVEASVLDWPIIKQTVAVGSCVVTDAGRIGSSAIRHAAGFGKDLVVIVKECVEFTFATITPGLVVNPRN